MMKKGGSFEGLMDEVYKTLYEKKNTKESKLTEFTKEVLLKIKKNSNQSTAPDKAKYALMFNNLRDKANAKSSNKTIFDKMNKIYSETILQKNTTKTKSEISNFLSTTRLFSSPHVTNTTNTTISSNQQSKISTPIKAKMTRVKSQLENLDDKEAYASLYRKKKTKMSKSNSMGNINSSINNLNNSRGLRTSLDNFRVDLEHFLKKDISANTSVIMSDDNSEVKKKNTIPISIKSKNKMSSSPNKKNNESFNNSNYSKFIKFLPKENIHKTFFKIGKKDRKNMSLRMNSFRTRMELQNL